MDNEAVAHNPTGTTAATDNLNNLEISSVRTTPGSPSAAALQAAKHGCYDPFRHLCAGSDSRSHLVAAELEKRWNDRLAVTPYPDQRQPAAPVGRSESDIEFLNHNDAS